MNGASEGSVALPDWAVVSAARIEHIRRVIHLLDHWSAALSLDDVEATEWHDAGRLHDCLRDESEARLRAIVPELALPAPLLHGPAAARLLQANGEKRSGLLEAIRHHTLGWPSWEGTGRALYCADFLEPGRHFNSDERRNLAERFPIEPESVFREVVRLRIEHALQSRHPIHSQTSATWNSTI